MLGLVLCGSGKGYESWKGNCFRQTEEQELKRTEEDRLSLHDEEKWNCNEATNGDISDNLDGVSLTAFGLPDDVVKGEQFLNGKVGSIAGITVADANAYICFLYS